MRIKLESDVRKNRSIKPKIRWKAKKLPDAWQGQHQVLEVQQALNAKAHNAKAPEPFGSGAFLFPVRRLYAAVFGFEALDGLAGCRQELCANLFADSG